jgi:hypothetical protein
MPIEAKVVDASTLKLLASRERSTAVKTIIEKAKSLTPGKALVVPMLKKHWYATFRAKLKGTELEVRKTADGNIAIIKSAQQKR